MTPHDWHALRRFLRIVRLEVASKDDPYDARALAETPREEGRMDAASDRAMTLTAILEVLAVLASEDDDPHVHAGLAAAIRLRQHDAKTRRLQIELSRVRSALVDLETVITTPDVEDCPPDLLPQKDLPADAAKLMRENLWKLYEDEKDLP